MSAATVSALALIALIVFFIVESRPQKKTLSMLDLAEFKDLPGELRTMIRSAMPNGTQLKKHWAHMSPQQKQMVMQQIASQLPQQPPKDNRPLAPSVVVKSEIPKIQETGLKPGFLLSDGVNKSQKKNTKNKKHDEVVTLSDVGASEDEEPISTDITDADA
jgi:uncharacterized membrane protein